jgi:hypothetical protein
LGSKADILCQVSHLLFQNEAALGRLDLVITHLMNLLLQKGNLLLVQDTVLLIVRVERFGGKREVFLDDVEGVLKFGLENLQLLLGEVQQLFGLAVFSADQVHLGFDFGLV